MALNITAIFASRLGGQYNEYNLIISGQEVLFHVPVASPFFILMYSQESRAFRHF